MDFFHCNACYSRPNPSRSLKYFVASCGHFLCNNCGDENTSLCKVCGKSCLVQPLTNQSENLKILLSNTTVKCKKILKAALLQQAHYKIYFQEYLKPLESNFALAREKMKQKENDVRQLQYLVNQIKAEIEELAKQNETLSRPNYSTTLNRDLGASNFFTSLNSELRADSGCGESIGRSSASLQTPLRMSPPRPSATYSSKTYAGMPTIQTFVMSDNPPMSTGRQHSSSGSSRNSSIQQQPRRGRKSGYFPLPNNPNLSYF